MQWLLYVLLLHISWSKTCERDFDITWIQRKTIHVLSSESKASISFDVHWYRLDIGVNMVAETFNGTHVERQLVSLQWLHRHLKDFMLLSCPQSSTGLCSNGMPIESLKHSPVTSHSTDLCPISPLPSLLSYFAARYTNASDGSILFTHFVPRISKSDSCSHTDKTSQDNITCQISLSTIYKQSVWPLRRLRKPAHRPCSENTSTISYPREAEENDNRQRHFYYFVDLSRSIPDGGTSGNISKPSVPSDRFVESENNEFKRLQKRSEETKDMFESELVELHAKARLLAGQMGAPATPDIAKKVQDGLLKFVGKGHHHQILRNVFATVTSRTPGQVVGAQEANVINTFEADLSAKVSKLITDYLTFLIPERLNRWLLEEITMRIIPQLHRDLDLLILEKIEKSLESLLPELCRRSLRYVLTKSLSFTLAHALTQTLTAGLAKDSLDYCISCRESGRGCRLCREHYGTMYYNVYYATYFADYYDEYYGNYYTKAADLLNAARHKNDPPSRDLKAIWPTLNSYVKSQYTKLTTWAHSSYDGGDRSWEIGMPRNSYPRG